jgi:hypothetical protein
MPHGRPQSAPEHGSLDGARRCICDPTVFTDCPGHRPPYLAGQRTRSRPSLASINKSMDKHEAAINTLKKLRPHADDDEIDRLTEAKTGWRAAAAYHWPDDRQDDDKKAYVPRGLPTGKPAAGVAGGGQGSTTMPARARPSLSLSARIMNGMYTHQPTIGQRVGFQSSDNGWTRGVVVEVQQQVVGDTRVVRTYVIGTDGLADKGWVDYVEATRRRGIFFVTPDKARDGSEQFTADETFWNADVAHLRIHVERAIKRIREFRVINARCHMSRKDLMSATVTVCALLCNFLPPTGGSDFGLRGEGGKRCCAYSLVWGDRVART